MAAPLLLLALCAPRRLIWYQGLAYPAEQRDKEAGVERGGGVWHRFGVGWCFL